MVKKVKKVKDRNLLVDVQLFIVQIITNDLIIIFPVHDVIVNIKKEGNRILEEVIH